MPEDFGERFVVAGFLGAGAHGAVFEVEDRQRGRTVALKSLMRVAPEALVRFKREFRVASCVGHPNLLALHELFVEGDRAWFTMELIHGTDFLSWVREEDGLDETRLRSALRQLASGLLALHAFGVLHRDLKPSNVLVTDQGHVVVADFGLARELTSRAVEGVTGTPAYMSPEQAAALALGPASDWYAFGVMLFEALTGARPFAGACGLELLLAKQVGDPGPPSAVVSSVPPDLDRLCVDLLARDPAERPTGAEVLQRLSRAATPIAALEPVSERADELFVGREDELDRLRAVYDRVLNQRAMVVVLSGGSGTGKSALLRRFIADRAVASATVLRGRCYERESVAYKGLDELVDELRAHLLSRGGVLSLAGAGALSRVFGVLSDVPGIGEAPSPRTDDPFELRRQAVAALRELLRRVAIVNPLVLVLDDLQWCDEDTTALLLDLLRDPSRPNALFIASVRTADDATEIPAAVARLAEGLAQATDAIPIERIDLGPLPPADAVAIAQAVLGDREDAGRLAAAIAAECEGNPLFVAELARHVMSSGAAIGEGRGPRLEDLLDARIDRLPAEARAVLETVAVASRPLPMEVAVRAAGAAARGLEAVTLLRSQALVRTDGGGEAAPVEAFHDRIAARVRVRIPEPRAIERHLALAAELERTTADPEAIAFHFKAGGQPQRAVGYVTQAAELAAQTLALQRAARLYGVALSLLDAHDPRRAAVQRSLADTLARDGRGFMAAGAYEAAARSAPEGESIELERAAAEQLLRSGRLTEGLQVLRKVLDAIGLDMPSGPRASLMALLLARGKIRMRGLDFEEHTAGELTKTQLLAIDTTWAAATGLLQSSVLLGQYFQARHLVLALDGGEPRRIARALGLETLYVATGGSHDAQHCDLLLERVENLCRRVDDDRSRGIAAMAAGVADVYRGRWVRACPRLADAEAILRGAGGNPQWELSTTRTFWVMALMYTGSLREMNATLMRSIRDAVDHDDRYGELMLRSAYEPLSLLCADRLADARAVVATVERGWTDAVQTSTYRYVLALTRSRVARYAGDGETALAVIEAERATIKRAMMLTKQPLRIFFGHDRGCAALWAAWSTSGKARRSALAIAAEEATRLHAEATPWGRAAALPLLAGHAAATGDSAVAARHMLAAERAFRELGMAALVNVAARRRGELADDAEAIARADVAMVEIGVVAPQAFARWWLPPCVGW